MIRFRIRQMLGSSIVVGVVIAALVFPSGWVAATVLLLTLLFLAVAVVGAIVRSGEARAWWIGLALFGWGYVALASGVWWDWYMTSPGGFRSWKPPVRPDLPTSTLLDQLQPIFLRDRGPSPSPVALERWLAMPRDRPIHDKLARPMKLDLADPATPSLEQLARSIAEATRDRGAGLPGGIPVDLDPEGLREVDVVGSTPLDLVQGKEMPLGEALGLTLRQRRLTYHVLDGRLTITALVSRVTENVGAFARVGHCFFAVAAGWIGATLCAGAVRLAGGRRSIDG